MEDRWEMVLARREAPFFFAVKTTGVYCRPSCPARRPRRENVVFFADTRAAERAGFRACRRCRPEQAAAERRQVEAAARRLLEDATAEVDGPTRRLFRRFTGIGVRDFADAARSQALRRLLRAGKSVTEALYQAGYGASSRLYERAGAQLGATPANYGRGGRGMRIAYSVATCSLGRLLVAATERGICAVRLGDSAEELERGLKQEFPLAERAAEPKLHEWTTQVLALAEGRAPDPGLPLDIRATAFQRRVWDELRRIPRGETRSYCAVARALDNPGAARAVARACASNPAALVVPCHRVVREDGSPGGYRWGAGRKRRLLDSERTAAPRQVR